MKGNIDIKKYLVPNLPYVMMFWFFSKIAEGYRLSAGTDAVTKAMAAVSGLGAMITANPLPSFHPRDLFIGIAGAAAVRAVVYFKGKNAKKYRHGVEYGSARWLAVLFQSQGVCRIWQAERLGTHTGFRQRTVRQRSRFFGTDRGRSPAVGASEGVAGVILYAGCRAGCCFVARFVAGKSAALLFRKPLILGGFYYCLYFYDNESNEDSKENIKSKNNRPDIRLQVLRCPLLDFVVVFLCLAISFMEVSAYAEKFRKEERKTGEPEKSAVYRDTGVLRQPDHAGSL